MSEDEPSYVPPAVLAGWSPGDEERPVPGLGHITYEMYEEARRSWHQPAIPKKYVSFTEIYDRQDKQVSFAKKQIEERIPLVLLTQDFRVYRANTIWGLLWIYLLTKLHLSSPRTE